MRVKKNKQTLIRNVLLWPECVKNICDKSKWQVSEARVCDECMADACEMYGIVTRVCDECLWQDVKHVSVYQFIAQPT